MNVSTDFINIGKGNSVTMKVSDPLHFDDNKKEKVNDNVSGSFKDMLVETIGKVNNLQVESDGLYQKMIYEPESVDIHQVMIAQQKAEIAISFTKAIRDEVIKSYRELTNLR
ncbi:MAG: flagellar hook-basal body complex protein FliE [Spirochaetes bacterium]|nr:flagellar hook-basal body complex protein FliE [Spirochaetota bacterium]MBN2770405.1 flagellar hook-basal body complex protein FliE [Spirochaetota bacterium]